jgi:adenylate cyclase
MTDHSSPRPLLRDLLRSLGYDDEELDRADSEHTLTLLALERMALPQDIRYDVAQGAALSGLGEEQLIQMWRSLGFPDPRAREAVFSDVDVANFRATAELIRSGAVSEEIALQMTRVIGSSMARVAEALIDAVNVRAQTAPPDQSLDLLAVEANTFLPQFPAVLEQVWRRHLQAGARRRFLRGTSDDTLVVGFADLVGFTSLAQQVSDQELAEVVEQFAQLTNDVVVAGGGRIVKMIGDEVMFVIEDQIAAAEIALGLADASRDAAGLSDVRVGMACGPVLEREGDAYGPTVNLASRITAIAYPGTVVVGPELHHALDAVEGYQFKAMRPRNLKDIGRVSLWVLRRDGEGPVSIRAAIEERRQQMREVVRERIAARVLTDSTPADDGSDPESPTR